MFLCGLQISISICCCLVAQSCPTLCNPMDCFLVLHYLLEFAQIMFVELMMPSNHLILCCPLLLLPSIFPSIRVFSKELALWSRWPKYWSFSFSISPSNECSGLISFRINWFDLLAVQGTLKSLLFSTTVLRHLFGAQPFLLSSSHIHTWLVESYHSFDYRDLCHKVKSLECK